VLDGSGGGVCALGDVLPVITGNAFRDNAADLYYGGAIHCEALSGDGGQIVIENNTFTGNTAYGGGALSFFNPYVEIPLVRDNEIIGNRAQLGGGVYSFWSMARVSETRFEGNSAGNAGGAVLAEESHDFAAIDCAMTGNTAAGRGGALALVNWCTTPEVTNCIITGNTASGGAGVYCYMYSSPTILGCQIRENYATDRGGAIFCENYCAPQIVDCALLENHAPIAGGLYSQNSQPTVTGCSFAGNDAAAIHFAYGWATHVPQVHANAIAGNPGYGVLNDDDAAAIAAQNNWWGDPSGPYHPTQNPGGRGDRVSDYVAFGPWLPDPDGVSGVIAAAPEPIGPRLTCSPNPFRGSTTVVYEAPGGLGARVGVYDVNGRLMRRLALPETGRLVWDGTDDRGAPLPVGIHYLRLEPPGRGRGTRIVSLP
jgi:predicted outer membrane repeat protein